MYITDIMRAFYGQALYNQIGNVAVFLDEKSAKDALLFKNAAYFLAAVNSSINVMLYCLYLPAFRQYWTKLFDLRPLRWLVCREKQPTLPAIFPLEEVPRLHTHEPCDDILDSQHSPQVWQKLQ